MASPAASSAHAASLRPRPRSGPVTFATKTSLRVLGRFRLHVDAEMAELDGQLDVLVATTVAELLALYGVGTDAAASLLVAAGDYPERSRPKLRGRTCAGCHRSRRRRARPSAIA